jgi:hypothetical protein
LNSKRVLPYLAALLLLAWILGSLARSGTGGGNLLSNSWWLVYLVELLPVIALGLVVAMLGYILVNWRLLSDVLGSGLTRKRKLTKKKSWKVQALVWLTVWAIAGLLILTRCHGLNCNTSPGEVATPVKQLVAGSGPVPAIPLLGPLLAFSSLVDTSIFVFAFFGLALLGSIILARAVVVHVKEVKQDSLEMIQFAQEHGRTAARDAIRLLDDGNGNDPRLRIMACYQRMVRAAADLGAPVGPDKTARELERGIKRMFLLNGSGISQLTGLFEVARYSLHPVTEDDSHMARECLVEISGELDRAALVQT